MIENDRPAFLGLLKAVFALHRQALSDALVLMYWNACEEHSIEQVRHAMNVLTKDADAGRFLPKPGDITRVLNGTAEERSMIAWGKVFEAMSAVGSYQDVVFDDPAIHATVQDAGGWPKVCRSPTNELGYVQAAFTKAHKAYTGRGTFEYPRMLSGDGGPDQAQRYAAKGLPPPLPVFVGDPAMCAKVYAAGNASGKTAIMFNPGALAFKAINIPDKVAGNDAGADIFDAPVKLIGDAPIGLIARSNSTTPGATS